MVNVNVNTNERYVMDTIQSRRTIFKFKPQPVPMNVLEDLLYAGIWAPNHHLTEPWRFTVIGEATKKKLAECYRDIQVEKVNSKMKTPKPKKVTKAIEKGDRRFKNFMSKPTIVAISCIKKGNDDRQKEDYASVCCAMQNIQLAGWEQGIGMQWNTGTITKDKRAYKLLGIDVKKEYIIGFSYMGYPEEIPKPKRKPLNQVLRWLD